jgi:hypothetical protein
MINGISSSSSSSKYLYIHGGQAATPYVSPGAQSAGMMRWNTNNNVQEIYDGNAWRELRGSTATVDLSPITIQILNWAEQKMLREQELVELAQRNESVKAALECVLDAEEKLAVISTLAK